MIHLCFFSNGLQPSHREVRGPLAPEAALLLWFMGSKDSVKNNFIFTYLDYTVSQSFKSTFLCHLPPLITDFLFCFIYDINNCILIYVFTLFISMC